MNWVERRSVQLAAMSGFALIVGTTTAQACGGTPPPFFCAKTCVLAKGVQNANLPAAQGGAGTIDTLHFTNFIGIAGQCAPAFPASVSMTAVLDCEPGPDAGPFNFGPFPIEEGFTEIPIDIPVPAGPPRVCIAQVTATVTFADGMQVSQVADQQICLLPEAASEGAQPALDVQRVGEPISCAHAGDEQVFCFQVSNNADEIFDGEFSVEMKNVADLPTVETGQNDTATGVWSLADPGGGDAYPIAVDDGQCVALPAEPHNTMSEPIGGSLVLLPGESTEVKIKGRSWGLCANGSCGEAVFQVSGFLGGEAVTACAGFVMVTDNDKPAALVCPGSGRAVTETFGSGGAFGPGAVLVVSPLPGGETTIPTMFELDISQMQMLIDGTPIEGGTPSFSGVTMSDDGFIRNVSEFSFIMPTAPPDSQITMITEFNVTPIDVPPGVSAVVEQVDRVPGAPNGHDDVGPFAFGKIMYTGLEGPNTDTPVLDVLHQISAVGVEQGTFNQVPMRTTAPPQFEILDEQRYRVTSTWTAVEPGQTPMIGFDVQNDFRGFGRVESACPGDFNGDSQVDGADLGLLLLAWDPAGPVASPADLNGDNKIDGADLGLLLLAWGGCE